VNSGILGYNAAGVLAPYTNISIDDSAAQFYSATASKGTLKMLLSDSTNGKLLTLSAVHTDNKTLYIPDPTTGDSLAFGSAPFRFNSGAATARVITVPDAAISMARIDAGQTFTGNQGFGSGTISTTGIISGAVGFLTKATTYTVGTGTAQEAYGYFFTGTAAFTFTVPTAVTGMNICFQAIGANLIKIKPTTNDYITLDGVILTQNYTIKSNWTTWGNKGPWVSNGS
jgi:hypothetical protein